MKRIIGQRGFTLVSVMMAAAIGAIVVIGMASSISAMFSAQTSVNNSAEAQLLVDEIRKNISDSISCRTIFAGRNFNDTTPVDMTGLTVNIHGVAQNLNVGAANALVNGLQISELSLVPNTSVPGYDTSIDVAGVITPVRRRLASLKIRVDKTGTNAIGRNIPPSYIPLQIYTTQVAGTAPILSCNNEPNAVTICNELANHRWNPATSECTPLNQCVSGGSFSNAPIGSGGFVNPLTGGLSCPAGFETRRSGSVAVATTCGKKCVNNTFYETYECSKCYQATGAVTNAGAVGVSPGQSSTVGVTDVEEATAESNFQTNANDIAALQAQIAALQAQAAASCPKIAPGSCCETTINSNGCAECSMPAPPAPMACP